MTHRLLRTRGKLQLPGSRPHLLPPAHRSLLRADRLGRLPAQEFHRKNFPKDDWKFNHGRMRQGTCMEAMEKVRLDPLGPDPQGADSAGFRARARKEYFDNRAAQAQNRVPQVQAFHTAPAPGWVPPKAAVAMDQLAAGRPAAGRRSSSGSVASQGSGGSGAAAAAGGPPAAGRSTRATIVDGNTSGGWQHWDSDRAIRSFVDGRAEQKMNRWKGDTPSFNQPI